MSYLVSQLRKDATVTYMTAVTVSPGDIRTPNRFGDKNLTFIDFRLSGTFQAGSVYYLRFKIKKIPFQHYKNGRESYDNADQLQLSIRLKNYNQSTDEETFKPQQIGTCTVPKTIYQQNEPQYKDQYSSFTFVFSPLRDFDSIVFEIQRVSYDALRPDGDYRRWLIDGNVYYSFNQSSELDGEVSLLNNIISAGNKNISQWLKFGFQSRPGTLIVVNNQPIRVGRSGIYECNNGMKINSFMIASPGGTDNSKIDAFLLDYAYNIQSNKGGTS